MINSFYLYLFFSSLAIFALIIIFLIFRPNKTLINNKILLKSLLEGFDLELPEELKTLDSTSTDPQKFS